MTWQRIEENTYIDDTLVTCAEYQLFIDEMREQGKYYQPDHWTSYQFPDGKAREPILGVRQSDAVAFCEWLTRRETNDWKYRLPTMDEGNNFILMPLDKSPLGYWITGDGKFSWVGDRFQAYTRDGGFLTQPLDLNHSCELAEFFASVLERRVTYENNDIYYVSFNRIKNLVHALDRELSFSSYNILDRPLAEALDVAGSLIKSSNLDASLYTELFTLATRVAGRSKACESIRLVREPNK